MEKLVKEERPIIIHIRRGDYLQYVNTIGVLTLSYYQQALELISQDTESKYWIFSDCLETSNDFALFANLPREDTRIINPPKKSTDSESLRLMSLGRAIVISNSTFSWWAARFSDRDAEVVAPATWYRNLESPKDFHLSNWKVSPSIWFDDSQIS
jgi:hypothetical protein